jgi:DNA-binding HxlR family transcriptional regulator
MSEFRYAQFCPLARATEVLGERWTLLIVRELLLGPQRFSDLRRRLPGLSTSVLSARLRHLEERGVLDRRMLPSPAASSVFELTELGQGLRGVVIALSRWGLKRMEPKRAGDHFEPSWMRLGLLALARSTPTPARRIELRIPDEPDDVVIHIEGGDTGTRIVPPGHAPAAGTDATVRAEVSAMLPQLLGGLSLDDAARDDAIQLDGDLAAVADLPRLFSFDTLDQPLPPASELVF